MLYVHIIIAVASVILSLQAVMRPSQVKLQINSALIALTLGSGVIIGLMQPNAIGHLCISGLLFTGTTLALHLSSKRKLAKQRITL